jgi:heat shock protein HspQ
MAIPPHAENTGYCCMVAAFDATIGASRTWQQADIGGHVSMFGQTAKFGLGEIVHHRRFDYRGVIFDVDATFQGDDDWYDEVAKSKPPKDQPWYHVLVDGSDQTTYVAERNLETEASGIPIRHPLIDEVFLGFENGSYVSQPPSA